MLLGSSRWESAPDGRLCAPPCPGPRSIPTQSNKAFPCHLYRIQSRERARERESRRGEREREREVKSCSASHFRTSSPTHPLHLPLLYPSLPPKFVHLSTLSLSCIALCLSLFTLSIRSPNYVQYGSAPKRMELNKSGEKSYFGHYPKQPCRSSTRTMMLKTNKRLDRWFKRWRDGATEAEGR